MARIATPVTVDDVRQWALDKDWTDESGRAVGTRGRLSSSLITAYNKAHPRRQYEGGGTTPGRPTQKPAETASNTPARPRERQVNRISEPVTGQVMLPGEGTDAQATMLVSEVIAALKATPNKGDGHRLVQVTGYMLV